MSRIDPPLVKTDGFGNTITVTESGQIGPYKGNRWTGWVDCKESMDNEENAKCLITSQVREGYIFMENTPRPFHHAYFTELKQHSTEPHRWTFTVERPYLD